MLINLNIKDFAIVEHLNLEFEKGMISLTGETGAGKSILLGAIGLVIGDKSNKNTVRNGAEKASVSATFDITHLPKVKEFLSLYDYAGEDENECMIRRVIKKDGSGRSSAFINDTSASLSKIKELGEYLVEIHGQHQHQSLSKDKKQLDLLDSYLSLKDLREKVSVLFKTWKLEQKNYDLIKENFDDSFNAYQLLNYQFKELDELSLADGEYQSLEKEMSHLESASTVISNCEGSLELLSEGDGLTSQSAIALVSQVQKNLKSLNDDSLGEVIAMVETAMINLEEASGDISRYREGFEVNKEREDEVAERLQEINKISDKMNVFPEKVFELKEDVESKMNDLDYSETAVDDQKIKVDVAYGEYITLAKELSAKRIKGAPKMSSAVNTEASKLNLSDNILKVVFLDDDVYTSSGIDKIAFYIRPNLGQEYQPMKLIASGGEMSRISLAVQVVSLKNESIPTMIFDEVDTGLSGETGNVVGEMLRTVGSLGQVMCVTHLPQVAAQGHSLVAEEFKRSHE